MSDLRDDAVRWAERVMKRPDGYDSEYVNTAQYILSPPAAGPAFDFDADFVTEMRVALTQLDELAHQWGDEGKFRGVRDRMRKAFKAFAEKHTSTGPEFDADGWRPIATAPKDGAKILLLCVSKSMSFGGTHAIQGYWGGNTGFENWITLSSYKLRPTHWMPLPPAPNERIRRVRFD